MGENNDQREAGGGVGFVAGLMAGTILGVGLGLLLAPRIDSVLNGEEERGHEGPPPEIPLTEAELEREEIIEALLQPDRSRHDELGRTDDLHVRKPRRMSSPREQGAAPIDITNVDE